MRHLKRSRGKCDRWDVNCSFFAVDGGTTLRSHHDFVFSSGWWHKTSLTHAIRITVFVLWKPIPTRLIGIICSRSSDCLRAHPSLHKIGDWIPLTARSAERARSKCTLPLQIFMQIIIGRRQPHFDRSSHSCTGQFRR